jgi:hypothetical protein
VYTSAKSDALPSNPAADATAFLGAEVSGYTSAFAWAAGLLVLITPVVLILARVKKDDLPAQGAVHMG